MPDAWLTPEAVAEYLGTVEPEDERVVLSTAAVKAAVEGRRSDLGLADLTDETAPADVRLGAILWAGVLVQQRSAPGGYDGYDADTAIDPSSSKWADISRLLGLRRPVVS